MICSPLDGIERRLALKRLDSFDCGYGKRGRQARQALCLTVAKIL
jgi:hypothetical protein